ncbi:hypothetical protein WR25_25464 [Diploscapter pachys]|uniref:Uncharacterized protein n=1 Tax=Diploscapter pachys TaxID=2018661 RepID=A0A2A2JP97_9BILA|nr:hypothetical protein WR25_25464 [Diploscapter pachys]
MWMLNSVGMCGCGMERRDKSGEKRKGEVMTQEFGIVKSNDTKQLPNDRRRRKGKIFAIEENHYYPRAAEGPTSLDSGVASISSSCVKMNSGANNIGLIVKLSARYSRKRQRTEYSFSTSLSGGDKELAVTLEKFCLDNISAAKVELSDEMLAVPKETEQKGEADQPNEPLYENPRLSSGSELSTEQSESEQSKTYSTSISEYLSLAMSTESFANGSAEFAEDVISMSFSKSTTGNCESSTEHIDSSFQTETSTSSASAQESSRSASSAFPAPSPPNRLAPRGMRRVDRLPQSYY